MLKMGIDYARMSVTFSINVLDNVFKASEISEKQE